MLRRKYWSVFLSNIKQTQTEQTKKTSIWGDDVAPLVECPRSMHNALDLNIPSSRQVPWSTPEVRQGIRSSKSSVGICEFEVRLRA